MKKQQIRFPQPRHILALLLALVLAFGSTAGNLLTARALGTVRLLQKMSF